MSEVKKIIAPQGVTLLEEFEEATEKNIMWVARCFNMAPFEKLEEAKEYLKSKGFSIEE